MKNTETSKLFLIVEREVYLKDEPAMEALHEIESRLKVAIAEVVRLKAVLETLARLGNGEYHGTSVGNRIGQEALQGDKDAD